MTTAPRGPDARWLDGPGALPRAALFSSERALADLETGHKGLSTDEARARLARAGPNLLPQARGPGLVRQLLEQIFYFFAVMLWLASGLAAACHSSA